VLGFGGQNSSKIDKALRLSCVQIYNDAMAEVQAESGQRLFPMALLPWWDVKESVKETIRCHKLGMRGININSDPQTHRDDSGNPIPDLATGHWDPLWEVCQDLDLPVNFHIGGSEQSMDWFGQQGLPSLSPHLRAGLGGAMLFFNNGRILSNLMFSGCLDRFPKLKFVSVESGIGWVPFILEALDYHLKEIAGKTTFQLKPAEYFRRNFYVCYWFEEQDIAHTIKRVGVDNVLFETDFPHPTSLYPIANIEERLDGLSRAEKAKVLGGNAARAYNIPLN
jgi:predicted TIM-barrel fold metal-dependent hydrolase